MSETATGCFRGPMAAYASRTGTASTLRDLRAAGWRLLVSAKGVRRTEGFLQYGLDNGAWTAFQSGASFDERAFLGAVEELGENADFVVVPDIVRGGHESLRFSLRWLERLWWLRGVKLIAVQDGVSARDIRQLVGPEVGIFIGGTDTWKERSAMMWGDLAAGSGCHLHMGRVNTVRRMRIASDAGCHSFDGTSVTRWSKTLPLLEAARQALAAQGNISGAVA